GKPRACARGEQDARNPTFGAPMNPRNRFRVDLEPLGAQELAALPLAQGERILAQFEDLIVQPKPRERERKPLAAGKGQVQTRRHLASEKPKGACAGTSAKGVHVV